MTTTRLSRTVVGLLIIFLSFLIWPNREGPPSRDETEEGPRATAPA